MCTLRTKRVHHTQKDVMDGLWFDIFHRFSETKKPTWLTEGLKLRLSMVVLDDYPSFQSRSSTHLFEKLQLGLQELVDATCESRYVKSSAKSKNSSYEKVAQQSESEEIPFLLAPSYIRKPTVGSISPRCLQ